LRGIRTAISNVEHTGTALNECSTFQRVATNLAVTGQYDPSPRSNFSNPLFVRLFPSISLWKVILMHFYREAGLSQCFRNLEPPEIAV